jgi:aromatic ring-cleaving dioxygenase
MAELVPCRFLTCRSPPTMPSELRDSSLIRSWHAHVYFDAGSRQEALELRQAIETQLAGKLEMGRFHEKPVGPHPMWSYQLGITTVELARVIGWLALNHGTLDVFVHPNTGDPLRDHRDAALWIGSSHKLILSVFDGDGS